MSSAPVRLVAAATLALVSALLVPSAAAAPAATVKVRVVATTPTVAQSSDQYFVASSHTSARCKGPESVVGIGLAAADRYLAASEMGWAGVEAYAVGDSGKADIRWQLLCAKNMKNKLKRTGGKPTVVSGVNTAKASAACPGGYAAVPLPFAQTFAPFMGSYSLVAGGNGWTATLSGFPSQVTQAAPTPVKLHVLCVPAKRVSYPSQTVTLDPSGQASGSVTCTAGRALGFGFQVVPFTNYPSGLNSTVPMVRTAKMSGSSLDFSFATPMVTSAASGDPVTVTAVCGTPKSQPKKKKK